jgi:hypothetical protein
MNLADVFTVVFVIVGFLFVYIAYWLAAAGLFPKLVERCAERLGTSPIKSTLLGLIVWGPVLAIGTAISNHSPNAAGKFIGVMIMIASALVALTGSAGLAWRVGAGLKSARDEHEPWRRVLRGSVVLALTFVLPFVGTAVMAWSFVAGFGALILARPRREQAPASLSAMVPPPMPEVQPTVAQ